MVAVPISVDISLFRGARINMPPPATIWCAAPTAAVSATFGSGGAYGEAGLLAAFGGGALFRDAKGSNVLLGVWGARNCSRFRRLLREAGYVLNRTDLPAELRLAISWG